MKMNVSGYDGLRGIYLFTKQLSKHSIGAHVESPREVGISFEAAAQHQLTGEASKDGLKICKDDRSMLYCWLKFISFQRTERPPNLVSISYRRSISCKRITTDNNRLVHEAFHSMKNLRTQSFAWQKSRMEN